eukprot:TRINITY_DN2529_c5_g1_i1.p1 TRINITY_DN2529_c5_g1~~TRINITY_DN2529_c5_g1_i1.p1  ORF type:complete len:75 (-),score=9.87 TRINITY_DN2529_c5_g1_i1:429-653(-)
MYWGTYCGWELYVQVWSYGLLCDRWYFSKSIQLHTGTFVGNPNFHIHKRKYAVILHKIWILFDFSEPELPSDKI